ncbi:hypothetical protein EMCRGX_G020823 [Ephydatia muelleri]
MEAQCRAHLQFTWRSSTGSISSSYGGPVQGPSPVHMEVQSISSSHGGPVQGPSPVHMEAQCRAHLQFTWRPSAGPISSAHGGPVHLQFTWRPSAGFISSSHGVQGPSPVHMEIQCRAHLQFTWRSSARPSPVHMKVQCFPVNMEVQCRAHLQFTWRPNAGSISSSHGGPMQGPSPVHMEAQCRVHLQFTWRPNELINILKASEATLVHMEVQCKVHLQFTWRSSARSISSSHGGPVQGASPVHMEVQLGPITSSHGGPVQGPSPQSGAGAAASQGYIIKVPGLKDETLSLSGQMGTTEDGSQNTKTPMVALSEKGGSLKNWLPRDNIEGILHIHCEGHCPSSAQSSMHHLRSWVTLCAPARQAAPICMG